MSAATLSSLNKLIILNHQTTKHYNGKIQLGGSYPTESQTRWRDNHQPIFASQIK